MRMSCNGCRVLRKGCSEGCSIRPCLQWIKSPESQAHATVFLAKFYGRAGLLNLINAGPEHLRPAIFRSLLYEACGRIVNPIYGSVGLLWSGSWSLCQTAVEAVLKGSPITPIGSEAAEQSNGPPLKAYDIRHVSKEDKSSAVSNNNDLLHRVRNRNRFKKSGTGTKKAKATTTRVLPNHSDHDEEDDFNRSTSHESSLSHLSEVAAKVFEAESLAPAEPELLSARDEPMMDVAEDGEIELELTLGFEPVHKKTGMSRSCEPAESADNGVNGISLGLNCRAQAG